MFSHFQDLGRNLSSEAQSFLDDAKNHLDNVVDIAASGHLVDQARIRALQAAAMIKSPPRPETLTGSGASARLGERVADRGTTRAMIVTTAGLQKRGTLDALLGALSDRGVEAVVYDKVEPDPGYQIILDGVQQYKDNNCDAVIAVGGGSAIDAAKAIVACYSNDKTPSELVGFMKVRKQVVPFSAVPTTAGTGSEVTVASVVTDPEKNAKYSIVSLKIVPSLVALDPDLTLTLPPAITAASGLDALTHAVESYVSPIKTEESADLSLRAAATIAENLPKAYEDGQDRKVREELAMASFEAGLAFTRAGVGYVHAIAHQLGGMYHMVHGEANAILMPHVMDFYKPKAKADLASLARALGAGSEDESEDQLADAFIAKLLELNAALDIPKTAAPLREEDIPEIAERALKEADGNYPVPRYMEQADCEAILRKILPDQT
ncbi:MAG: iron-containing alcohol dehydrogenase [Actinobacteria bacterium]|nr:iron-containing alcohol dehydrogenase [Actinomycetota bacterium]